ncbi:MAG TPA: hypothetical protein VM864_15190 [Pyrinomonadaceae bacterium]|jgi:hypothetical protein|nr:hypothetical protein [Pyrinomonadaceae bacterium]
MFSRVLRYLRLPLVLLLIWAVMRFLMQPVFHADYAPRGNAVFSVLVLMFISSIYFGAMSNRVGGFNWLGTVLCGATLGLWAQILIFTATLVSFAAGIGTYFLHWDALNLKPEQAANVTMAQLLAIRGGGLLFGIIGGILAALVGRAVFSALAPRCGDER